MDSIESLIIHALSEEHRSVMITDIAEITGLNRHTVARRLDILEILGKVRKIQIGNAKRYHLVDSLPIFSLVDISSDLIIVIDESLRIQYINKSAQTLFNLMDCPVIGERIDHLSLELFSAPQVIEGLKKFTPEKVSKMEIVYTLNGTERWYEISIMNISLKTGFQSMILIAVDITEKKGKIQQLKDNEARYRSLFENAPIPINEEDHSEVKRFLDTVKGKEFADLRTFFDQNPEKVRECIEKIRIVRVNHQSRRIYRCGPDDSPSTTFDVLPYLTPESIDVMKELFISLDKGIIPPQCEISTYSRGGGISWYLLHYSNGSLQDNDFSRVYVSFQDITRIKQEELLGDEGGMPDPEEMNFRDRWRPPTEGNSRVIGYNL